MNWYVLLDGQQTGPLTDDQIKQMIYSGQIKSNDLVWNERLPQWVEAGSVRGLFDPGDQIPLSPALSETAGRPKNTGIIIALTILIIILVIIAGLLIRFYFFSDSDETTILTTEPAQITTSESEQPSETTTETNVSVTTTESAVVTEPAETTTLEIETEMTTEIETEMTTSETETESAITQSEILYIMHMADSTALGFFTEAFETELDGGTKASFEEIRPALLEYWSESMVDDVLLYFYDEYLFDWGYEMVQIFPFHDMEALEESFVEIISQTDQEIIVHTYIDENMMYDGYPLDAVLIYENERWVVDEYYSDDAE